MFLTFACFGIQAQTQISKPVQKDLYPKGYFNTWVRYLDMAETTIVNPNTYWQTAAMEYFNRFLMYAKMETNTTSELLAVFMDGYTYNKDYFCERYDTVLPLRGEEYAYMWKIYTYEKPAMDALCNCVRSAYDQNLISKLKDVEEKDQRYRGQIGEKGLDQLKKEGLWAKQLTLDAENIEVVAAIIKEIGYPDRSVVGYENESIAFLVVQHSNPEMMEQTLPLIKASVDQHLLKAMYYAYLFDRIAMLKGEPQYYGTQFTLSGELYQIRDQENVNQRRAAFGMAALD